MIKPININKIQHHPQNPRRELGDLEELAESIKQSGVLQNLTLVPIPEEGGQYYAVIGNRRLAAAKIAGLTEVPCAIVEMNHKTQIATMLLENMQRSDLTVHEQAQGFQMMIDLGESVTNISDKTGFSETTVRRRVKLLELDQVKLKEAANNGGTLTDYLELEKIKDIETRNLVLEKIGTSEFNWALKRAVDEEKQEGELNKTIFEIEKFAMEIEDTAGLSLKNTYRGNPSEGLTPPEDAEEVEYFFKVQYGSIYLYYKREEEQSEEDLAREERNRVAEEKRLKLAEVSKRGYDLRKEFVKGISNAKAAKGLKYIVEKAIYGMTEIYGHKNYEDMVGLLDINIAGAGDGNLKIEEITEHIHRNAEKFLLVAVHNKLDSKHTYYYDYQSKHRENKELDRLYDLLINLGYEISEEETALREGTHELFETSD